MLPYRGGLRCNREVSGLVDPLKPANQNGYYVLVGISKPVPTYLTSLKQVFLLNRNGYSIAFGVPVPSRFTFLEHLFLLNRNGCWIALDMPVPSRFDLS